MAAGNSTDFDRMKDISFTPKPVQNHWDVRLSPFEPWKTVA
jgi:hypothetical protein